MIDEIPLSRPDITDVEIDAVVDVLKSGRLSLGPRQDLFEQMVAERCNRRHGVAVSSGTAGLHLCLLALGVGPGDEVITTPFSFVASANVILMVGAKPVFVDIDPVSLNLDPSKLESAITPRTKAIIPVEVFGETRHMRRIAQIARAHEIAVLEDCCEALGGECDGVCCGGFGRAGVFGFYPNKQITTGEGGMIVTDDDRLADVCRSLRNQGRSTGAHKTKTGHAAETGSWLAHERLGYNYRLSEIACALGIAQMQRLDEMLHARRQVASLYMRRLMDLEHVVLPDVQPNEVAERSWFVFVLRLASEFGTEQRDRIIAGLKRHDIGASNYFPCIHLQPFYREQLGFKPGDFPLSESISERTIALPFHTQMTVQQVDLVCKTLRVMIDRERMSMNDELPDRCR